MSENKRNINKLRKISLKNQRIVIDSYIPYNNKDFHLHHHHNKKEPHLHGTECEVANSALDLKRHERYYFTSDTTPVRVYINYEKNEETYKETSSEELSQKFIKEASKLFFCKTTRSFIPKKCFL